MFVPSEYATEEVKRLLKGVRTQDSEWMGAGLYWLGKPAAWAEAYTPPIHELTVCESQSRDLETTKNIFIEGDNLEAMKLLLNQYKYQVKMIYIDPPYNTGKEFLYSDRFDHGESAGCGHSGWLSMIYPRLILARQLLKRDGVLFISIDDHEQAHLKILCDEIFSKECFLGQITIQSNKRGQTYKQIAKCHEYLLVYGRSKESCLNLLPKSKSLPFSDEYGQYDLWELRNRNPKFGRFNRPNLFFPIFVNPYEADDSGLLPISLEQGSGFDRKVLPLNSKGEEGCWRWSKEKIHLDSLQQNPKIIFAREKRNGGYNIYEKSRKTTMRTKSIWLEPGYINERGTVEARHLGLGGLLEFPKPLELLRQCIRLGTEKDDIVLDFFAGSGTTAHALMAQNSEDGGSRRFVCIQALEPTFEIKKGKKVAKSVSKNAYGQGYETIAEICRERIRRAGDSLSGDGRESYLDVGFKACKLIPI